jgi:hypothetical protein
MTYKVGYGDSPTRIARAHNVRLSDLVAANPHKVTAIVAGNRTFKDIHAGERLRLPFGIGDSITDTINALVASGGPCLQANVMLVCAAQTLLGVTVDGKWGSATSTAARARGAINAPAACSPRPVWWAPIGQSSCPIVASPSVTPVVAPAPAVLAPAAVLALGTINPCDSSNVGIVCAAQKALGVTVDGKYGTTTAGAARKLFSGAPPACDPRPVWWAPVGQTNCGVSPVTASLPTIVAPAPVPASVVPAAVQALATINPCLEANVAIVFAAQKALGVAADGKYGTATASAAQKVLPGAPSACSPRPAWWAPVGMNNPISPTAAATAAATIPAVSVPTIPVITAPSVPTPTVEPPSTPTSSTTTSTTTTTTEAITPPEEKKKLSTGAIVAGAIGAAALVGIVAIAATGKKSTTTIRRVPSRHRPKKRKSSHRKKH